MLEGLHWSVPIIVLVVILLCGFVLRLSGALIGCLAPLLVIVCIVATIVIVFEGC